MCVRYWHNAPLRGDICSRRPRSSETHRSILFYPLSLFVLLLLLSNAAARFALRNLVSTFAQAVTGGETWRRGGGMRMGVPAASDPGIHV